MTTTAELQALTYRELQAACKKHGIPARGTKADLLGKLLIKVQEDESAQPKSAAAQTSGGALKTPKVGTAQPSPHPKVTAAVMHEAVNTPLPVSPSHSVARKQARARRMSTRSFVLGGLLALVLAALTAAALPYCQRVDCVAAAQQLPSQASAHVRQVAAGAKDLAARASTLIEGSAAHLAGLARAQLDTALAAAEHGADLTRDHVSRAKAAATAQYELMQQAMRNDANGPEGAAFSGMLDLAALDALLPVDVDDPMWGHTRRSLEEIWGGEKINPGKANTVLFACGTDESCAYAAEHLGSTAPADSVLQLSASALSADRGKLQQQLAGFLREEPQGVVVVKGLDRLNPALLPVLINGMSEQGAYQHGGRSVAASGATFLLTWKAPQAVMAEDSMANFHTAAKATLQVDLTPASSGEAGLATATAFRRRIDLVAPVFD